MADIDTPPEHVCDDCGAIIVAEIWRFPFGLGSNWHSVHQCSDGKDRVIKTFRTGPDRPAS